MMSTNHLYGAPLMLVQLVVLFALGGCSSDPNALPVGPKTCEPSETLRENGDCQPAGIPPEMCAVGFVPDGNRGCEPILPAEPCPDGMTAIPGETLCRQMMPCGSGDYGDIQVDSTTIFVNDSYLWMDSDGSHAKPWKTIQAAVNAATNGAIIAIATGTYTEDVLIQDKSVKLQGRCPTMVEVKGTEKGTATIQIDGMAANDSELRWISITGPKAGIHVTGTKGVTLTRIRIHDIGDVALETQTDSNPTDVVMRDSLIERATTAGVRGRGVALTIERSEIRDTRSNDHGEWGQGIHAESFASKPSTVTVQGSLIFGNREAGIFVDASNLFLEATVVRNTLPAASGYDGMGIVAQNGPGNKQRPQIRVEQSRIDQNKLQGITLSGVDLHLENTVVVDNELHGIEIGHETGNASDHTTASLRAIVVGNNQEGGILIIGSDVDIHACVVRDSQLSVEGFYGRGIQVQNDNTVGQRSNVQLHDSLLENNHEAGIYVVHSDATIAATLIRGTIPNNFHELGDGVVIASDAEAVGTFGSAPPAVIIAQSRIENNARAGIANFGGNAVLTESELVCHAFDLNGENSAGYTWSFDGSHDNKCGCPEPTGTCGSKSSGLEAPDKHLRRPG
jgi:hypothetical protein